MATPSHGPGKPDQGSIKDKLNETIDQLKKNEKLEGLYTYAKSNTKDTVAYILLILGIILLLFQPFYGGLLVGIVIGLYFGDEILGVITSINSHIEAQGMVRSLIFGGAALAFFIAAPSIFIGAGAAVGLKYLFANKM